MPAPGTVPRTGPHDRPGIAERACVSPLPRTFNCSRSSSIKTFRPLPHAQPALFSQVPRSSRPGMRRVTALRPERMTSVDFEVLRPDLPRGGFRSVLFDFDGTLSLLREGWPQVMIPMMVEVLQETGREETPEELAA